MKKLGLMLLLAVAMVFVSCKEVGKDATSMIPADATYVAAIDGESIIGKAGIKIEGGEVVFPDSYKSLVEKGMSGNDKQELADFAKAGVDFSRKIYVFGSSDFEAVGIVPVADRTAFKAYVEKQAGAGMETDGAIDKMETNGTWLMITDAYFVCATPRQPAESGAAEALVKNLVTNGYENSIESNADAMEMLGRKVDAAFYADYQKLFEMSGSRQAITQIYGNMFADYLKSFRGIGGTLNFNKGDVEMQYASFVDENEAAKQMESIMGKPSAEGLKFIPADMQLVFSGSVKGEELLKVEAFNVMFANMKANPFVTADEIKGYIASIDGPVTIGYNYVDQMLNRSSIPQIYGAIKTGKADELCQKLQSSINQMGFIKCTRMGNEYVVSISSDVAVAFGSADGFFYFRTSPQKVAESMYDDDLARGIFESTAGGAYANLRNGSRANSMLASFAPNLKFSAYLEGRTIDNTSASVKLVVEEPQGDNILETLLTIIADAQM